MIFTSFVVALPAIKNCNRCGGQFVPTSENPYTCGPDCRDAFMDVEYREYHRSCFGCGASLLLGVNFNDDCGDYCLACNGVSFAVADATPKGGAA